ncbi:ImmA/IrrE family metallo-endopeptidase [Vibrio metschnikovii]|uniref:XRE family transcriptional regulator n=3 Tax=Unclassified Bacteria TaxID=49928 RepID=A0AAU6TNI7_UNCXX|nr:ImmA/IrrE family metallo-endopeptidase [Vibrio metschnikovii]EKO3667606.1 ImmA/IrrE family metallo-endopeptidase [Vibrio metschnikovii]EKO3698713.1 ImmA/IrrE family metallo-endopeptidase [Vibrio metschnikovii]EKO3719083.1 ImmA/IrrE family metallo-endopeptidase [Vibrio metschnikovii]EKO3736821.1 ImmA/IrrE family metallo-endopeptidase [Vibrio metschnikovii]
MKNFTDTTSNFFGNNLKLARILNGLTLAELAESIGTSRQYVHQLETSSRMPTEEQTNSLAKFLKVKVDFFSVIPTGVLDDTSIHFRSNRTAKQSSRIQAKVNVALFIRLVDLLSKYVNFPELDFPSDDGLTTNNDIERIAEKSRAHWELGLGPIDNMTRVAECAGAITTTFSGVSAEVDALSSVIKRPVIVRNDAKDSPGRLRFDIAHEVGHIIMHQDIVTGCKHTESQANRYASSFLLPRSSFVKEFKIGSRMDWRMLSALKERWGVSKAAILYRARQLDLITESRYKGHVITLRKYEAKKEKDDHLIPIEHAELIPDAIENYMTAYGKNLDDLLDELHVDIELLNQILDFDISKYQNLPHSNQIVHISRFRK